MEDSQTCLCGCGGQTSAHFVPGDDNKYYRQVVERLDSAQIESAIEGVESVIHSLLSQSGLNPRQIEYG